MKKHSISSARFVDQRIRNVIGINTEIYFILHPSAFILSLYFALAIKK